MMDKEKLLEEGLLEKFLLGELGDQEAEAVQQLIDGDAEIKSMFQAMEADFERMAFENAVEPPERTKNALKERLDKGAAPRRFGPMLAAASIALVLGLAAFWMFSKWQNAESDLDALRMQTTELQQRLDRLESNYLLTTNRYESINNARTIPLVLYGNRLSPESHAVAYVDHTSKTVLLNPLGLAKLPSDKTYQMWSDVDGEMIDMGIIEKGDSLIPLKYIEKAESVNITIEPAGGNDHPTVSQLISFVTL